MKELRAAMRQRRGSLTAEEIAAASARAAARLWRMRELARSRRIGCYLAVGGEIDCGPLMEAAAARGRTLYLPVLHGRSLVFAPWRPGAPLACNRFGIPEPDAAHGCLRGSQLDLVLTPLLAFDARGHRLGMGGGYYDRAFAFTRQRGLWRRPHLVGLAHEFQRVETLPVRTWDVALHAVVTDQAVHRY